MNWRRKLHITPWVWFLTSLVIFISMWFIPIWGGKGSTHGTGLIFVMPWTDSLFWSHPDTPIILGTIVGGVAIIAFVTGWALHYFVALLVERLRVERTNRAKDRV